MKQHLRTQLEKMLQPDPGWKVTGISDISGEGTLVTSKGKKRLGFDYTITLTYEGKLRSG